MPPFHKVEATWMSSESIVCGIGKSFLTIDRSEPLEVGCHAFVSDLSPVCCAAFWVKTCSRADSLFLAKTQQSNDKSETNSDGDPHILRLKVIDLTSELENTLNESHTFTESSFAIRDVIFKHIYGCHRLRPDTGDRRYNGRGVRPNGPIGGQRQCAGSR
jgi:hypothetical protein